MHAVSAVTVLVPIHNGARFIADALQGLLAQTFTNFEILCIDDGSTDDSAEIVRSYSDPRIRLIQHTNRGLCESINVALREVTTPYVARNDQDDISAPSRLQRQFEFLESNPDFSGVFTHYTKFGTRGRWDNTDKQRHTGGWRPFRGIQDGCQLASTLFIKTDVLKAVGGFRQDYYPADDWDLELRLVERFKIGILEEPLVAYRFHVGANTYPHFARMQERSRWAENSHRRRIAGQNELPFDVFTEEADIEGAGLARKRLGLAALNLRWAGQHYLDGRFVRAIWRGALAFVLNPNEIIGRIRRRTASHTP